MALVFALLLASALSVGGESTQSSFVSVYKPEFNVNAYASLDLDMREIESLAVTDGDSGGSGFTLQDLAAVGDLDGSETLKLYKDFYGTAEYSDKWLRAALNGESTESFSNGKADFTKLDLKGRSAAVQHGIRAMAIWGHIVGLVEKTADDCDFDDTRDKSVEQKMWDRAVALYVGSTARCKKGEEATVNKYIMDKFANGKLNIDIGGCSNLKNDARDIKSLMTVPLIQAASRAMYTIDKEGSTDGALQGEAAAYAAALLPLIHQCGAGNSKIIEADMLPGKSVSGSYEVVKAAFERCYEKLNVSCEDVGGLVDFSKKQYKRGAQACGGVMPGQGVIEGFAGSFPAQSPTPESQKSQPYQPAAPTSGKAQSSSSGGVYQPAVPTSGKAQSSSSGGVNIALIVGLSSVCTLFFVLMVVALSKRKSPRSHKSPPNVMFEMGDEGSSVSNPNGGEPAMALDENGIV
ncbi:hypothetical protein THAOC_36410 [Thalassiosira oceanica]|uniref:Uncharacterized protein n=1 Tax=Thalassiosira oceanica TaxID=159749 RepID=K0QZE9_THAOC|nr:hypothetical protein THAOC_36410 [Thalassiosira oceanica]|eukprot:EJK45008.1 hypothetical protein THAOC_36410 [Thalassiosira oceanica]